MFQHFVKNSNYTVIVLILDSERSEEASGFTMVFTFFFFILFKKCLPEGVIRFQHI